MTQQTMAGNVESPQRTEEPPEANPQRLSLKDRVNTALEECWQIDTKMGRWVDIWTSRFQHHGDPEELISVNPEGEITFITVREAVIRDKKEAREQAKWAAPGSKRGGIRKELEKKGIGKLLASMVAFVSVGATTESIAKEFGLDDGETEQAVEGFLLYSWHKATGEEISQVPFILQRILEVLEQSERGRLEKRLKAKLERLAEAKPKASLLRRLFLLTRDEMEKIRDIGFDLPGRRPLGQTASIRVFFPGLIFPEGRTSIIDLSSRFDGTGPGAARVVLLQLEQSDQKQGEEDEKEDTPPYAMFLMKPEEFKHLRERIKEE